MIKAKQSDMADFPMQQEQAAYGRLLAALKATQRDCPGMKYVAPPPHSGFPVELIKQLGEKKCKHRGHNAMQSDHGGEKRPGRLGIGGEKKAGRLHTPHMRTPLVSNVQTLQYILQRVSVRGLRFIESLKSRQS